MKNNEGVLNFVLLLVGTVGITFTGVNWHMAIPAWIAPVFLLMYTRRVKWWWLLLFFAAVSVSGGISQTCNNLQHLPEVDVFNGISYGIFCSLPFVIDKLLYRKGKGFYYSLIFPASVALVEFAVSQLIGTFGSVAHTQYEFWPLMQLGAVTGIFGIWFMVAWFASVVNWMVENRNERRVYSKGVVIYAGALLMVVTFGVFRVNKDVVAEKSVKVAAVLSEMNILETLAKEGDTFKELAENYDIEIPERLFADSSSVEKLIDRTNSAAKQGANVIVWNELALIVSQTQKGHLISKVLQICRESNAYVLLAFLEECVDEDKKPFNNVSVLISPSGEVEWEYRKSFMHPAEVAITNKGNFEMPVVETEYGRIGSVICADLDIPNYIAQAVEKDADILLVPAYDWEKFAELHAQMASIEAIQYGFSIFRANGKGISAVYNRRGEQIASLNNLHSKEMIFLAELPVRSVETVYSRVGNVFVYLCFGFIVFVIVERFIRRVSLFRPDVPVQA